MSSRAYQKGAYDRIGLVVKKGLRTEYQQAAEDFGLSLSELFKTAVEAYIADRSLQSRPTSITTPAPMAKSTTEPELTADQKRLVSEFSQLPTDVQKYLLKTIKAINGKRSANPPE